MNLREKLIDILPKLLPHKEQDAIKGKELVTRAREMLDTHYSDNSLLTLISLLAMEPDSCVARVSKGQGYYLRRPGAQHLTLQDVISGQAEPSDAAESRQHRVLALGVRLYDTMGLSVLAYPVEDWESWGRPDLVAIRWPAGHWGEDGAYTMEPTEDNESATYRAVCLGAAGSPEACRQIFYRALACGQWAHEAEALIIGELGEAEHELCRLSSLYGVGVWVLPDAELPENLPAADAILRASEEEARSLINSLPQRRLTPPRCRRIPTQPIEESPDGQAVHGWAQHCIFRRRVEAYERRVAIN